MAVCSAGASVKTNPSWISSSHPDTSPRMPRNKPLRIVSTPVYSPVPTSPEPRAITTQIALPDKPVTETTGLPARDSTAAQDVKEWMAPLSALATLPSQVDIQ